MASHIQSLCTVSGTHFSLILSKPVLQVSKRSAWEAHSLGMMEGATQVAQRLPRQQPLPHPLQQPQHHPHQQPQHHPHLRLHPLPPRLLLHQRLQLVCSQTALLDHPAGYTQDNLPGPRMRAGSAACFQDLFSLRKLPRLQCIESLVWHCLSWQQKSALRHLELGGLSRGDPMM